MEIGPTIQLLRHWLVSIVFVALGLTLVASPGLTAELQPHTPAQAAFHAGVKAYQTGQFVEAIQSFTQAINIDPQMAPAYGNRCLAELQSGKYAQAVDDCTHALTLNPSNTDSHLNRGLAYYRLSQSQAALGDFSQALEQSPDDYRAYYNRGLARFDLQDYAGAIADYNHSLEHSPSLPDARMADIYNDRAVAYLALEQPSQALTDLNQAIQLNQQNSRAYFNRACCHHKLGNWTASLQDYDRILASSPDYPQAYFNRAVLHHQMGQTQAAIADFSQAAHQFHAQGLSHHYQQAVHLLQQLQTPRSTWG